ncbi:hypothetical protein AXFE_17900 [Acidithrix ferrooxidans]|uniref:Uncharacterized protein n=1 Tax=Acidithrix ferrooxidans TaxID=1280514 RepID=A0A0D8HJV4_9ACTN|nr:hypothetical protein AXFE_17900 [Acidithrix ferrooxidans]
MRVRPAHPKAASFGGRSKGHQHQEGTEDDQLVHHGRKVHPGTDFGSA